MKTLNQMLKDLIENSDSLIFPDSERVFVAKASAKSDVGTIGGMLTDPEQQRIKRLHAHYCHG